MERFFMVFTLAVFTGIGFVISYTIQFKLNMLGANYVTIEDIIAVWTIPAGSGFWVGLFVFIYVRERIRKLTKVKKS